MAGPNPVVVTVGADTTQLKSGLNAAGVELSKMKEGMGKARETAMFFTQALGEFGPQGRTAQIALSGIAGAIMGGGGVLLALSLAQTAVRLLTDAWREEKEAAEKAAKAEQEAADARRKDATEKTRTAAGAVQDLRSEQNKLRWELEGLTKEEIAHRLAMDRLKSTMRDVSAAQARAIQQNIDRANALFNQNQQLREWLRLKEEHRKADESSTAEGMRSDIDLPGAQDAISGAGAQSAKEMADAFAGMSKDVVTLTGIAIPKMDDDLAAAAESARIWKDAWSDAASMVGSAMEGLSRDFLASFTPMLTTSEAFSDAMQAAGGAAEDTSDRSSAAYLAMAQNALAALAQEAAMKAIFQTAEGIAALWTPGLQGTAGGHFQAAAMYGAVAATAGVGAYAIGQNRGMTASEQQQVDAARNANQSPLGSSSITGSSSEVTKRETVYVIAPGGFTEAEVARVTARALNNAERLGYLRGTGA